MGVPPRDTPFTLGATPPRQRKSFSCAENGTGETSPSGKRVSAGVDGAAAEVEPAANWCWREDCWLGPVGRRPEEARTNVTPS